MTLEKARELILQQLSFGSGYNRNAVRLILGEIQRTHDQSTVDGLILELRQPPKIKIPALLVYASVFCVVPRVTYNEYAPLGTP